MTRSPASLLALLALSGCAQNDQLPDHWTLTATGITVEVTRDPYRFTVKDGSGKQVLASRGKGAGDGYGAVGWTSGHIDWKNIAAPGYYQFDPVLDPWRDGGTVTAATLVGTDRLEVTVSGERPIKVVHQLRASTLRVEATIETAATDTAPRAVAAAFDSPANEGFLGFGERFNRTNQRGMNVYSWPEEGGLGKGEAVHSSAVNPWPNGEEMTYYPIPFFISTAGYAFQLDSTWRNEFNLASDNAEAWRVWHIGPSLAYEVYVPIPGDARPWPQQLLDVFTAAVGRPMVPPAWAFGPRRRINDDTIVDGVPEIQRMRDLDLAITVADDATHFLPRASQTGREARLAAWNKEAAALGFRTLCYFNALFSTAADSPLKSEVDMAIKNHWFIEKADGTPSTVWLLSGGFNTVNTIDFTNPAAVDFYTAHFKAAIDLGYYGWMYDFGEYVQPGDVSHSGLVGEQYHNLFPVLYDKALHDTLQKSAIADDWLVFARSGYTGSSQYVPVVWSGDPTASFEDAVGLPAMARAGVNMGLSGVPNWGSDIGGYKCIPDNAPAANGELLARWIQLGAAGSDMHDEDACAENMGPGEKASIWSAPEAQASWKTYGRLHTRLFPYLYTLAQLAHKTGAPTMRHVFFEHPDRPDLASVDDAYYLGPSLLVAPVVKRGAVTKDVDLPAGYYLDWRDQKLVTGGAKVTLSAPLDKLPILLRDGYLVPLLDATIDTLDDREQNPDVVGPKDVAGVLDVVGLVSKTIGSASFDLWDGRHVAAAWTGGFAAPALPMAASEAELQTCAAGCWRTDDLGNGLKRVRITMKGAGAGPAPLPLVAGGLQLSAFADQLVRWDLYLVE